MGKYDLQVHSYLNQSIPAIFRNAISQIFPPVSRGAQLRPLHLPCGSCGFKLPKQRKRRRKIGEDEEDKELSYPFLQAQSQKFF
jgi:hypothetical protein